MAKTKQIATQRKQKFGRFVVVALIRVVHLIYSPGQAMKASMPAELEDDGLMDDSDESDDVPSDLEDISGDEAEDVDDDAEPEDQDEQVDEDDAFSLAEGSDADSEDGVVEADSLAVDGFDAHSERCRRKRVMVVTTHRCIGTDSSGIRYGCYAGAG